MKKLLITLLLASGIVSIANASNNPYLTFEVVGNTENGNATSYFDSAYLTYFHNNAFETNLTNLMSMKGGGTSSINDAKISVTAENQVIKLSYDSTNNVYDNYSLNNIANNTEYAITTSYNGKTYTNEFNVPANFYNYSLAFQINTQICKLGSNGDVKHCEITTNKPITNLPEGTQYVFAYRPSGSNNSCPGTISSTDGNTYTVSFSSCHIKPNTSYDDIIFSFLYTSHATGSEPSGINEEGIYNLAVNVITPSFN